MSFRDTPLSGRPASRRVEDRLVQEMPRLRRFVRFRMGAALRSREAVSDVVQSVCREVLERASKFRDSAGSGFRKWLFLRANHRIVDRNRFYRAARRDSRREAPLHREYGSEYHETGPVLRDTPSRVLQAHEELGRVERALQRLPQAAQQILRLVKFEGLSYAEVARRLEQSQVATRKQLSRALARLEAELRGCN
ncbi:MAG: sigma-70 family RNA polymerase sigma factor [Planctomycetota bacterium]